MSILEKAFAGLPQSCLIIDAHWEWGMVPGVWKRYAEVYRLFEGVMWFCKGVPVSDVTEATKVRLRFKGVAYRADVFVNGALIGMHESSYTEFAFDVTKHIKNADPVNGIWCRATAVSGSAQWAYLPMGGVWLCQHLWEHYVFSGDTKFLKEHAYPVMKGSALFCLDWLVEDGDGFLVTNPSTSPKNAFLTAQGEVCNVSLATTGDISMIHQLFVNCIKSSVALNEHPFGTVKWHNFGHYVLCRGKEKVSEQMRSWQRIARIAGRKYSAISV